MSLDECSRISDSAVAFDCAHVLKVVDGAEDADEGLVEGTDLLAFFVGSRLLYLTVALQGTRADVFFDWFFGGLTSLLSLCDPDTAPQ